MLYNLICVAQNQSLKGIVIDTDNKIGIENVSIIYNKKQVLTDAYGNFEIEILNSTPQNIEISHIGYSTIVVPVKFSLENNFLKIELHKAGLTLNTITVTSKNINQYNKISAIDLKLRPINSSQDVLRAVPGLFIAQHAGGGKAEQIFLRGFDIDHGTDINITVDGMPVNMTSHAHGQGYADLHFLNPETIEKVTFDKGPYNAEKGNLTTAGYVDRKKYNKNRNRFF
jgi:TonB-dependent Receptor Plug Domain/CarboxypepD_reg-like domain